jgi:uncharacterized protein YjbI with pentapeptide repeats
MKFIKMIAIGTACAALAACGGNDAEENLSADTNLMTDINTGTMDMNMTDMNMTDMNMTDANMTGMTDMNATDANMTDMNTANTL